MTTSTELVSEIPVPLHGTTLRIAVAQIQGPYPDGKHRSFVGGRETFYWRSGEEVKLRAEKARATLDFIEANYPDTNILIFPEYSLPIEFLLADFHDFSNRTGCIVIPGADNFHESTSGKVYNRSPIILPNLSAPIWTEKYELSQWEIGYVDPAVTRERPVFTWTVDGRRFWFTVYICLDFPSAADEPPQKLSDSGIFLVPMCSPEIDVFRTIGDLLLRHPKGRACILCNAVGEKAAGTSSILAVTPTGQRLRPPIQLSSTSETLLIVDLACDQLVPPRVSPLHPVTPLSFQRQYRLVHSPAGFEFRPEDSTEEKPIRGIINPAIFEYCDVQMRMCFLRVHDYAEVAEKGKAQPFEVLAVLGKDDIVITHLGPDSYSMKYDVNQIVPQSRFYNSNTTENDAVVPHFKVDTYYKVLGKKISQEHRNALRVGIVPSKDQLQKIFALGENWHTPLVTDQEREWFVRQQWVLDQTQAQPGYVTALMLITLDFTVATETERFDLFKEKILPLLVERSEITSLYGGSARELHIHYVVRITTQLEGLYPLIALVHNLAFEHRLLLTTTTYVVVSTISRLKLADACLRQVLAGRDRVYARDHLLPRLALALRADFERLPEPRQKNIVDLSRRTEAALDKVGVLAEFKPLNNEYFQKIAEGLVANDVDKIAIPHNQLQRRVESILAEFTSKQVTDIEFERWSSQADISRGKDRNKLTFGERIRILRKGVEEGALDSRMEVLLQMISPVVQLRNLLAHPGRPEEITAESVIQAIEIYCEFIVQWPDQAGRTQG